MNEKIKAEVSLVYDALDIAVGRMSARAKTVEEKDITAVLKTLKDKLEAEQKTNIVWRTEYDTTAEVK